MASIKQITTLRLQHIDQTSLWQEFINNLQKAFFEISRLLSCSQWYSWRRWHQIIICSGTWNSQSSPRNFCSSYISKWSIDEITNQLDWDKNTSDYCLWGQAHDTFDVHGHNFLNQSNCIDFCILLWELVFVSLSNRSFLLVHWWHLSRLIFHTSKVTCSH